MLYRFKLAMRWIVKGLIVDYITNVAISCFKYHLPFCILVQYVSYVSVSLGLYVPLNLWLLHVSCFKVSYFP